MATESPEPSLVAPTQEVSLASSPVATEPPIETVRIANDGDEWRWRFGAAAYGIGVVSFATVAVWAGCSIDDALELATGGAAPNVQSNQQLSEFVALLYVAKAILVLSVGSFAFALIRAGERLTMPLVRYLEMVELQSRKGGAEERANTILEEIRKLIETGTNAPKG